MKVVMINDCAYVGETLIRYLPKHVEAVHIKRTRGLWSKTFGIAYKILRATGDAYHAHYLLQDCYIASKLGKRPLLGHAHGTDLRSSIKHFALGRIVKHNLKNCDKILVSTPDVLDVARSFCENADYMPNPVDTGLFYPKSLERHEGKLRVLLASGCDWKVKGTDRVIRALGKLEGNVEIFVISYGKDFAKSLALAESLGIYLSILPKTSHQNMREYYWNADIVIGSIGAGVLGMVALEAIACGRPVITYVSSEYGEYHDFPLKDINTVDKIAEAVEKASPKLWKMEFDYLKEYHQPEKVMRKLCEIYASLVQ